jgi:D-alanyl-lipoteichoic acid acyltransferase DltB (MBOAT superfamily)
MPEVIAGWIFSPRKWEDRPTAYRVICGIGAVGNLMMMMMANLVGFAVGIDGLKSIIHGIFRDFSGSFLSFHFAKSTTMRSEANRANRYDILGHGLSGTFCRHTSYVRGTAKRGAERHFP